jgi:Flp pilus assembly protein TadD
MSVTDNRLEQLRLIAEREPDDEVAQYGFGKACLNNGLLEEAISALTRATQLNPGYSAAYRDLGRALSEAGRVHDSIRTLRSGIRVAQEQGDLQTVREMEVFLKRAERKLEKSQKGPWHRPA